MAASCGLVTSEVRPSWYGRRWYITSRGLRVLEKM